MAFFVLIGIILAAIIPVFCFSWVTMTFVRLLRPYMRQLYGSMDLFIEDILKLHRQENGRIPAFRLQQIVNVPSGSLCSQAGYDETYYFVRYGWEKDRPMLVEEVIVTLHEMGHLVWAKSQDFVAFYQLSTFVLIAGLFAAMAYILFSPLEGIGWLLSVFLVVTIRDVVIELMADWYVFPWLKQLHLLSGHTAVVGTILMALALASYVFGSSGSLMMDALLLFHPDNIKKLLILLEEKLPA